MNDEPSLTPFWRTAWIAALGMFIALGLCLLTPYFLDIRLASAPTPTPSVTITYVAHMEMATVAPSATASGTPTGSPTAPSAATPTEAGLRVTLVPQPGRVVLPGQEVVIEAQVAGGVAPFTFDWRLSGAGALRETGGERAVYLTPATVGEAVVTLLVRDAQGDEAVVAMQIIVLSEEATRTPTPTPTNTAGVAPTETQAPATAAPTPTDAPTQAPTGRLEVTYPLEMVLGADDVVSVEILVDPKLAAIGEHPAFVSGVISIESSTQDEARGRIEERIRLYAVMSAELVTSDAFAVTAGESDKRRLIVPGQPATWTWGLTAKQAGTFKITVQVFGETSFEEETFVVLAASKSRDVVVLEKPWPGRLLDALAENWVAILGTGGPLGLLLAYLKYQSDKENKALKEKIAALEARLKELEEGAGAGRRGVME